MPCGTPNTTFDAQRRPDRGCCGQLPGACGGPAKRVRAFNEKAATVERPWPRVERAAGSPGGTMTVRLPPGEDGTHDDRIIHRRHAHLVPAQAEICPIHLQLSLEEQFVRTGDLSPGLE